MKDRKKWIVPLLAFVLLMLFATAAMAEETKPEDVSARLQSEIGTNGDTEKKDAEEQTAESTASSAEDKTEEEPGGEKKPAVYTVSYYDGETLLHTETVEAGGNPAEVPEQNAEKKTIRGWALDGTGVDPLTVEIGKDTKFTAWYAPELNSSDHIKYINGSAEKDGSCYRFLPNGKLTRAQAAQMLYNLLSDKSLGIYSVSFPDVKSTAWYYEAVRVLASAHIIEGYKNGNFCPTEPVTRAEFVTMLCRLIETDGGTSSFTDVKQNRWYYEAVSAASQMGWVNGYGDGSFGPNRTITRAEAVTILNRALGRHADRKTILAGNFLLYTDVADPSFWAFDDIMEASVDHKYEALKDSEVWTSYDIPRSGLSSGLKTINGSVWYVDEETDAFVRAQWRTVDGERYYFGDCGTRKTGAIEINGQWFYCDPDEDGAAVTGTYYIDGYRYTLKSNGGTRVSEREYMTSRVEDVYSSTNWLLAVDLTVCKTGVFYWDDGEWELEYLLDCAPGAPGHETPTGTYKVGVKGYSFYSYGSWQYYYTGFIGGTYLFHSITYNSDGSVQDGTLGKAVSHGCVRLSLQNAKWIYNNIPTNTTVYIYE